MTVSPQAQAQAAIEAAAFAAELERYQALGTPIQALEALRLMHDRVLGFGRRLEQAETRLADQLRFLAQANERIDGLLVQRTDLENKVVALHRQLAEAGLVPVDQSPAARPASVLDAAVVRGGKSKTKSRKPAP